jgi:nucleoside 2-deoxyribosyltransferase
MNQTRVCFVVMPFRPELNYFYLYFRKHLEEKHGLLVERGDSQVLTKALIEKIREQIHRADLIIADVTGANPNVFYEIGLAHAFQRAIVFLTQDPPEKVPVDLRQFEFIQYDLARHEEFLSKLDNAVHNVFARDYLSLFELACRLLKDFNSHTSSSYQPAHIQEFQSRVMRGENAEGIPGEHQEALLADFLLPKIIAEPGDVVVMRKVTQWVEKRWATPSLNDTES